MKAVLKQNEGPMKIDTLIETMIAQKFRGDRVERAIEELTQSGELMQPRPNVTVQLM
jgi:hypothetical protein